MKNNFYLHDIVGKSVVLFIDNQDVKFLGYVKCNKELNPDTREIAEIFLNLLFQTWSERFKPISKIKTAEEFCYESLKNLKIHGFRMAYKNAIDTNITNMSVSAICVFPKQQKTFWVNTGTECIYTTVGMGIVEKLSSEKKAKTLKDQSIFSNNPNKAEGMIIDSPKAIWIVSADANDFFEDSVRNASMKKSNFMAFASGKKMPMIIGMIDAH